MAPRATWSGVLRFSLLTIPVRVYKALDEDPKGIKFNQISPDGNRVNYCKVDGKTGAKVASSDILSGYEVEKGRFVTFSKSELDAVKTPSSTAIDVSGFVDDDEIDPTLLSAPNYLAPHGEVALGAYATLARALENTARYAIGKITMRGKEIVVAIGAYDGALVMYRVTNPALVRPAASLPDMDTDKEVDASAVALAENLIESMAIGIEDVDYSDAYADAVHVMIDAKSTGTDIVVTADADESVGSATADVMDLLKASIAKAA